MRDGGDCFKLKEDRLRLHIRQKLLTARVVKHPQVALGGGGCPIHGNIRGQVGWGSGQPGLGEGVPAHSRGLGQMVLKGPFQPKLFCASVTGSRTGYD